METTNAYNLIWGLETEIEKMSSYSNPDQADSFHNEAALVFRRLFGEHSGYEQELDSIYAAYPRVLSPFIITQPEIWDEFVAKVKSLLKVIEKDMDEGRRPSSLVSVAADDEFKLVRAKLLDFEFQGNINQEQKAVLAAAISRLLHDAARDRDALRVLDVQRLETRLDKLPTKQTTSVDTTSKIGREETPVASNNRVFIVHGHNEDMKRAVAAVLQKLGLDAVVLDEKPNEGRTIIEKLTEYSDVHYAVILLSPDDMGYLKEDGSDKARPRARQNVILELGYFLAKIGRNRVTALYPVTPDFEFPSDYLGVIYVPYDESESWKYRLVKELQAARFDVDANKLL